MTTAARPTFYPAVGGNTGRDKNFPTQLISSKLLPAHTKLKLRLQGQDNEDELKQKDFKEELAKAENEYRQRRNRQGLQDNSAASDSVGNAVTNYEQQKDIDKDDPTSDISDASESDEDDSEDETAELMRELEKIRRERAEEKERLEKIKAKNQEQEKEQAIVRGNPLMVIDAANTDFSIKRRWDDDVVFKNQAKIEEKPQKRFVNDTLRSDFHRKFLTKYIK